MMMMIDGDGDAWSPPRASRHGYAKARQAKKINLFWWTRFRKKNRKVTILKNEKNLQKKLVFWKTGLPKIG